MFHESPVAGSFSKPEEHRLEQGTQLHTLDNLGREWRISFQFNPEKWIAYGNLLELNIALNMYISLDMEEEGPEKGLGIWFPVYELAVNQTDALFLMEDLPPIGNWTSIEVGQREEDGEFTFYVSIDANETYSVRNSQPMELYNVTVYASIRAKLI